MSLGLMCLMLFFPFQEEVTPSDEIVSEELGVPVADRFHEALSKFNSVQQLESEAMFEEIIAELELKQTLDEEEHLIMTESLTCMGVINYPEETEAFFEKLIRFDPALNLNPKDLPPKIVSLFDGLKGQLVGSVRVTAVDAGTGLGLEHAVFVVDNKVAGPIFGETVFPIFNGIRQVAIRCPNYEEHSGEIIVEPGVEIAVRGFMIRNATEINVVTYPPGATVLLNEVEVGKTDGETPRDYRQALAQNQVSLKDTGALLLNDLPIGEYKLTLQKPCYKSKHYAVTISEPQRMTFNPVFLEDAGATLNVSAVGDNSGLVFLGKQRVGYLPVENHKICPGTYELRVRFTDGEFIKNLTVEDGDEASLLAEPLPSIAWFGLQDDTEGDPPGDLDAWISSLKSWNVHTVNTLDPTQAPVNPFPILFGHPEISDRNRQLLLRQPSADLYMAARVVRRKVVIRNVEVAFWTPLSRRIHIKSFDFREFNKFRELLGHMDAMPPLTRPWLGVQVAKLRGIPGCKLVEVHPNGPLAGKANPGDFIGAVNGNPLRGPEELMAIKAVNPVTLSIGGNPISVTPLTTIAEVAFNNDHGHSPLALLARLEKLAKYHPDKIIRDSALFNQARYQLLLGDYTQAYDIFSTMTLSTPYGINQGTLYYYQGLCFRRLKQTAEATRGFQSVLKHPHATLFDAYGPKAAFWAEAELNNPDL